MGVIKTSIGWIKRIFKWIIIIAIVIGVLYLVWGGLNYTGEAIFPFEKPVSCLYCGDLNEDGTISQADLSKLNSNINLCNKKANEGDLNLDGCVNNYDLDILSMNYKKSCQKISLGILAVTSNKKASIFIDGIFKAQSDSVIRDITPGNHTITIVSPGSQNQVKSVFILANCQSNLFNANFS